MQWKARRIGRVGSRRGPELVASNRTLDTEGLTESAVEVLLSRVKNLGFCARR